MSFDWSLFGEICMYVIPVLILTSMILNATLRKLASHNLSGMQVFKLYNYLFFPAISIHELIHRLMCAFFGLEVEETVLFRAKSMHTDEGESFSAMGYVRMKDIHSVIAALFTGLSPLFVNAALLAVICYYYPLILSYAWYPLIIYLAVALCLGTRLSTEDLTLWSKVLKRHPKRGFLELLFFICILSLIGAMVFVWQVDLWICGIAALICFTFCCILSRYHPHPAQPSRRAIPRV